MNVQVGNGEKAGVILIGKQYRTADGVLHNKTTNEKGESIGKYEVEAAWTISIDFPIWTPEDMESAAQGHFIRKMQEFFGSAYAKNSDVDMNELAPKFTEKYFAVLHGEKAEREAVVVDPVIRAALAKVEAILKGKTPEDLASTKTPIPSLDDPPKTKNGKINYNAWAKVLKAKDHPWYALAYKKASEDKGFD